MHCWFLEGSSGGRDRGIQGDGNTMKGVGGLGLKRTSLFIERVITLVQGKPVLKSWFSHTWDVVMSGNERLDLWLWLWLCP